jgi:hypothetical protein
VEGNAGPLEGAMSWLSKVGGILTGSTFTNAINNRVFGKNSTMGRMLSFSNPGNIRKNWSEYMFGGGLPIQAGLRAMKLKSEDQATAQEAAARVAAHNAEVDQLSQTALGAVNMRRRRGGAATMLTGSPMMGSSPGSSGKTLLSQ